LVRCKRELGHLTFRRLGTDDRIEPSAPGLEGGPLLRIVRVTVVDGRDVALGVVQDFLTVSLEIPVPVMSEAAVRRRCWSSTTLPEIGCRLSVNLGGDTRRKAKGEL